MVWLSENPVQDPFSSLYTQNGDTFTVNDDCLTILEEILEKLNAEDCMLRTFRRAIGFGQNVRRNLVPLLLYIKDDTKINNATKIIDTTIKILVNLTIPIEYLLSIDVISKTDVGKHTIHELNKLLTMSKEVFTDSRSVKAVMDHMKFVVDADFELDFEQCDSINNCLLLVRNVLHIPENKILLSSATHSSMQNQIIWNLFTQGIDKIIIYLMSCSQKMYWGVSMVQLIALLYKDQHVGTLQKLLNLWLEASYSESSEDNESNTSPPDQGSGDDSSPIITSDPTSDSSDTGGNDRNQHNNVNNNKNMSSLTERNKTNNEVVRAAKNRSKLLVGIKRNKSTETENSVSSGISSMNHSIESDNSVPQIQHAIQIPAAKKVTIGLSSSEISDCGYVTQVENQESISTSSNDDEQPHQKRVHQKPHTFQKSRYNSGKNRATTAQEKKELRRKKLVKRSKTNIINMKGLMHHLPTDEDIANILKEFTVDFLLKGYGALVHDLHSQFIKNAEVQIDTSHFFWLVTYFLKFATQLELDLEHISPVLSYEILSYLIFQGVWVCEELEISCHNPDMDLKPCLRRLHLVVTAIREFLQGIEAYQKMIHLSDADRENLRYLQNQIREMGDLKMLFVLLLRQYNPDIQSKQYLQDLILTNHNFLLFLDNASKIQDHHFNMMEHLKQFATVEIMRQYGLLLEGFKDNGEFVNNCIFTMMHHIGGDLKNIHTLFQPSILKTFSQIWETDYGLCDDWSDLIEYVIHKFINTPGTHHCTDIPSPPINMAANHDNLDTLSQSEKSQSEWTSEEKDNLLKYYNQARKSTDSIAKITKKYEMNGTKHKTQTSIIKELFQQNIITESEYNDLMKDTKFEKLETVNDDHNLEEILNVDDHLSDDDIKVLKDYLVKENKGKFVLWLQSLLIEACYVKLVLTFPEEFKLNKNVVKPSIYYPALLNLPIPVIPWTSEQSDILKHQPFILLLHKLGFFLPADMGKVFVRIPNFWTADYMFSIAQQLGVIHTEKLKFDVNKLKGITESDPITAKSSQRTESFPTELHRSTFTDNIRQLTIAIPEADVILCNQPPPELAIAKPAENNSTILMEYSPTILGTYLNLIDDLERTSNYDTASVASDLTRMCVSDEEDKVTVIIEKTEKIT